MWKSVLGAALAFSAISPAAAATTVNITGYSWDVGAVVGDIAFESNAPGAPEAHSLNGVGIGRFDLTGTSGGSAVSFETYCADIFNYLSPGSFTISAPSVLMSNTAASRINALLSHTDVLLAAATGANALTISAATQLAVWEILYEGGSYNLSTGDFRAVAGNHGATAAAQFADAKTAAEGYLSKVVDPGVNGWRPTSTANLTVLYSPTRQSQVYLAAVPEPATWGMMLVGFGVVGGFMRRRARQDAAALA